MKHSFFILLFALSIFSIIPMNASTPTPSKNKIETSGHWGGTTRSVTSNAPELYQTDDTIFIYSDYYYYNVNVTITNSSDEIVQSSTVTLIGGEYYPYIIDANPGSYKITLTQGSRCIYGYFAIE